MAIFELMAQLSIFQIVKLVLLFFAPILNHMGVYKDILSYTASADYIYRKFTIWMTLNRT